MWDDGLLDWADQERLVRQDVDEMERKLRRRKAEAHRRLEEEGNERADIKD